MIFSYLTNPGPFIYKKYREYDFDDLNSTVSRPGFNPTPETKPAVRPKPRTKNIPENTAVRREESLESYVPEEIDTPHQFSSKLNKC